MAKQTFTTGQVLTSAQMTALQANDYNQTVSAKTANYVLVAADAGTRVTMSNAGATTITVNTSLFTAGDTLFITNIGVGACTITAGTATVSTASSLVLAQYDSGRLYFTSTGVAIWEKYQGATTAGMTVITSGALSSTSTLINSIPATYTDLILEIDNYTTSVTGWAADLRMNDDATASRHYTTASFAPTAAASFNDTKFLLTVDNYQVTSASTSLIRVRIPSYANTTTWKLAEIISVIQVTATPTQLVFNAVCGVYNQTAAITSLRILPNSAATIGGTYTLWGVK